MGWFFKYMVLYSAPDIPYYPLAGATPTQYLPPVRLQREVAMPESLSQGPIFYLLIAWGIVTAIFLVLLIWRSLLESHEDDQLFIDAAEEHMAKEQRDLVAKINTLSRPIMASGVAAGALLLAIAGLWLYTGLRNF
jgi:hypothetical protein